MLSDIKLRMKPAVAVQKLIFQSCISKSEKKQQCPRPGNEVRKINKQSGSVTGWSSPSYLSSELHFEEVAMQGMNKIQLEKSPKRTTNRKEKQSRFSTEAGNKDSSFVGETSLRNDYQQNEENSEMKTPESQQQNETFSTAESDSCSSMELSDCFVVEDVIGVSPNVEIINQKEPRTYSAEPVTEQQKYYKEFMCELLKLKQELDRERELRRKLESKISRQSKKIKELKREALSREETLKHPPIRLKLEAMKAGKYASTVDDHLHESSDACSSNSYDAAEGHKPELCVETPTEDATDGLHVDVSTFANFDNMSETQRPTTDYERMRGSARRSSTEKNFKKHSFPAFDDSVWCAEDKVTAASRKRKVSHKRIHTNSGNKLIKQKNGSEVDASISNSLITSEEGVNIPVCNLDIGIKLQQQTETTAYLKEVERVDKKALSVLNGSVHNSVNEDLGPEDSTVKNVGKRHLNKELQSSDIILDSSIKSKKKPNGSLMNLGNKNHVTTNDTTDTNITKNHDEHLQISEVKTGNNLNKMTKSDGNLLHLPSPDLVSEKHTLHTTGKNEQLKNQSSCRLADGDYIQSESCSRKQNELLQFSEIKAGKKVKKMNSKGNLMHRSSPDLVSENCTQDELASRNQDTRLQFSETKTSKTDKKKTKQNNSNPSFPSIDYTEEDGVQCSERRNKSISPECKTKNLRKGTLNYFYGCNLCGLKFSGMESMQCHIPCAGSPTGKDPLKCGACSKTFGENKDLEKHLQGLHRNKLFKCETCSKNCASKSCLVWHMRTHMDTRPNDHETLKKDHRDQKDRIPGASDVSMSIIKCENPSKAFLSEKAKAQKKSSDCTICKKQLSSKLCQKQHKENEKESHPHLTVDCPPESLVAPDKSSNSREPMNRSFQDASDVTNFFIADTANEYTKLQGQERSLWTISDQDGVFCNSGSSLPVHLDQKISCEQERSSVSIYDVNTCSQITTGQKDSTGLICAKEISPEIKMKTYRPYCVKCWDTFEDLEALEEHVKFCNESCWESSPRELNQSRVNECLTAKSENQAKSRSERVMENGSEEVAKNNSEDVAQNGSVDMAKSSSFEVLMISSDKMAASKLHDGLDEVANDGLDELPHSKSHDWAKNSSDGLDSREPNDLAIMLHVLAKNASDDFAKSESDDLAETFSEVLANIELNLAKDDSVDLANSESDFLGYNDSEEVANGESYDLAESDADDLAEYGSDDLDQSGSDELVKNGSGEETDKVTKCGSSKLISGGSLEFYKSRSGDLTKSGSRVARNRPRKMDLTKSGSHKLTKTVSCKVSKCGSHGITKSESNKLTKSSLHKVTTTESCKVNRSESHEVEESQTCEIAVSLPDELGAQLCDVSKETRKWQRNPVANYLDETKNSADDRLRLLNQNKQHNGPTDSMYQCSSVSEDDTSLDSFSKGNHKLKKNKKRSLGRNVSGKSNQVQKKKDEKQTPKRFYGCGLCGYLYVSVISLKRHLPCEEGGISRKDSFFCGECNERFCEVKELEKHIGSLHGDNLFSCTVCNKTFAEKTRLNLHLRSHFDERPHKCIRCSKAFKYAHHLKYHTPCSVDPGSEIQCDQCQMKFLKLSQLRTHLRIDHNNKAVQCDICGKKLAGRYLLDVHLKRHAQDSNKPYSCTHCTKCFASSSSLKRHLQRVLRGPFRCNVCNQNFNSKVRYDAHLKSHSSQKDSEKQQTTDVESHGVLCCPSCHKTFSSQWELSAHVELHKQFGSSFSCSQCKQKFCSLDALQEHVCQTFSIQGLLFRCPECEEGFQVGRQLKKHLSEVHSIEHRFKCKDCGKEFEKFCLWTYHIQAHCSDRRYICNKCGKAFKFLHHLKSRHLPCIAGLAELKCPKCNHEFMKPSQLRTHLTLCQNERAIQCQVCSRLFNFQSKLDKHMRCHTGEKPYQCPQCDKCFGFREGLLCHVQRHSAEKPYVCDVCSKAFAAESFLRAHLKCHTTDRPHKCRECDLSFVYACHLRYHNAKVHKGLKTRFVCSICNKTFGTKMYLNIHMCSHTGQNPYLCSFCGKGFPAKILLKYHLRVHTGEKPYSCQYCYRRFSMPRSMRNHERIHTGEKPYECTICGMKFPQSSYLKNHSKNVHMAK